MLVTVMPTRFASSYTDSFPTVDVKQAIETSYNCFAHIVQYYRTDQNHCQRLTKAGLTMDPCLHDVLRIDTLFLDFDAPKVEGLDVDRWKYDNLTRMLNSEYSTGWYTTRKGFRLIYRFQEPVTVTNYEVYTRLLHAKLVSDGFTVDELPDWTRLFKLPFVVDGKKFTDFNRYNLDVVNLVPNIKITENRNTTLTKIAGSIRKHEGLSGDALTTKLLDINNNLMENPLDTKEVAKIAGSISNYVSNFAPPKFKLGSENEVSEVFLQDFEATCGRTVYDRGKLWYYYDNIWKPLTKSQIELTISSYEGAQVLTPDKQKTRDIAFGVKFMENTAKLVCMKRENDGFFDNARPGIAFRNGFLDSLTGSLVPHDRNLRLRNIKDIDYIPGQIAYTFANWLANCFSCDPDWYEKVEVVRSFIGACLLGVATKLGRAMLCVGDGHDGKSTLLDVMKGLFEYDEVTSVSPHVLDNEYYRAMLSESVVNIAEELSGDMLTHSEPVKAAITGNDMVARRIRDTPFRFKPKAGHAFSLNNLPAFRDYSRGFLRRWLIVEFNKLIPENERLLDYHEVLLRERTAIINWCVDGGLTALRKGSYGLPVSSVKALELWSESSDSVLSFKNECELVNEPKQFVNATNLYNQFVNYVIQNGLQKIGAKKFSARIKKMNVPWERRKNGMYYGIKPLV